MHYVGMRPVLVHGGGPQISELMQRLDQTPRFVEGYRVTGPRSWTSSAWSCRRRTKSSCPPSTRTATRRRVSGEDANFIGARRMESPGGADLGFVGEIERVDPRVIHSGLNSGFIPVIAPMALGGTVRPSTSTPTTPPAPSPRVACGEARVLTDVEGLYEDFGDAGSLLSKVTLPDLERLLANGALSAG